MVLVAELRDVPFNAEVPKQRCRGPERQRVRPPSGVGFGRPDMGTHHFGRDQHRCTPLNRLAFERIVAVARPNPLGATQDFVVDPGAAARTRLEFDCRMLSAKRVEQSVQRKSLSAGARCSVSPAALYVVTIHVPLHIRDVVITQQRVECLFNKREGGWIA